MKRINTTLAMLTLLTTSAAFAATSFAELDVDQSGALSMQEASADATLAQQFTKLDANQDGQLSEAEYNNAE